VSGRAGEGRRARALADVESVACGARRVRRQWCRLFEVLRQAGCVARAWQRKAVKPPPTLTSECGEVGSAVGNHSHAPLLAASSQAGEGEGGRVGQAHSGSASGDGSCISRPWDAPPSAGAAARCLHSARVGVHMLVSTHQEAWRGNIKAWPRGGPGGCRAGPGRWPGLSIGQPSPHTFRLWPLPAGHPM